MTDNSGNIRVRYEYDSYGSRAKLQGDLDADFGFTGHYYHQPSGLHLALYRAFDANMGRWISRDPITEAGGLNLYTYAGNDPINNVDPLGLTGWMLWHPTAGYVGPPRGSGLTANDLAAAAEVGASMIPGIGEAQDASVILDPDSKWWEKGIAGASLGANALTDGLLPNAGGMLKACKKVEKGKKFSKATKDKAKALNCEKNGGVLKSEKSGQEVVRGKKHEKGVTPPDNEAHVDHRRSRADGGDNSLENAQILSRRENLQKGAKSE